jgi:hypothetical protein
LADFIKTFWAAVVSIAVVGGMYFGAKAINAIWEFGALIGVALIAASIRLLIPRVRQIAQKVRQYPVLIAENSALREDLQNLRQQLGDERGRTSKEWSRGVSEGRREAVGAIAASMNEVPILDAVTTRNGQLLLRAATTNVKMPYLGALYLVQSALTNEIKGTVRIVSFDASSGTAFLECTETRVVAFWQQLEASAQINPAVPPDVRLVPYALPPLEAGGQGPAPTMIKAE